MKPSVLTNAENLSADQFPSADHLIGAFLREAFRPTALGTVAHRASHFRGPNWPVTDFRKSDDPVKRTDNCGWQISIRAKALSSWDGVKHILVVDDDRDSCANLLDILAEFGYSADAVDNGGDALELVRRNAYAMAILDFRMMETDGLELLRRMKDIQMHVQTVLITPFPTWIVREAALSAGVQLILQKPIDAEQLLRAIRETVD